MRKNSFTLPKEDDSKIYSLKAKAVVQKLSQEPQVAGIHHTARAYGHAVKNTAAALQSLVGHSTLDTKPQIFGRHVRGRKAKAMVTGYCSSSRDGSDPFAC